METTIKTIVEVINICLICLMLIVPIIVGVYLRKVKEMAFIIPAIALALFFTNLEKLSEFTAAGINVKVNTAVHDINELKKMAVFLSTAIVNVNATPRGYGGGTPVKEELKQVTQIADYLRNLRVPPEEIEKVCANAYQSIATDHVYMVFENLERLNPKNKSLTEEQYGRKTGAWDKDKLDKFIKDNNLKKDEETEERIKDIDYFLKNKKLRREDKWY